MADVKEQVLAAFVKNKGKYEALKAAADDLVTSVLSDAQGVIKELETAEAFAGVAVDLVDEYTSTGLFDAVDGPLLKLALSRVIGAKTEAKYAELRAKALSAEIQ